MDVINSIYTAVNISYRWHNKEKYSTSYNLRFDPHENYIKSQNVDFTYKNNLGNYRLSYLDKKSKTEDIIVSDKETLNYEFV